MTRSQPKKMSLAACIRCCLATTRSPSLGSGSRRRRVENRRLRFFGLEEKSVGLVAAEQENPGPGSHTADADHLASYLDHPKLVRLCGADRSGGALIRAQHERVDLLEELVGLGAGQQVLQPRDQPAGRSRSGGRPSTWLAQLVDRRHAVLGAGLDQDLVGALGDGLGGLVGRPDPSAPGPVGVQAPVPHVQGVADAGQGLHPRCDNPPPRPTPRLALLLGREAPWLPTGHHQTAGQPLHIPLPRPRQRLIEVVDIEV